MSQAKTLPPEVLDIIFDVGSRLQVQGPLRPRGPPIAYGFARDTHYLASCSLVCKKWVQPSRRFHFANITLRYQTSDVWSDILESPQLTIGVAISAITVHKLPIMPTLGELAAHIDLPDDKRIRLTLEYATLHNFSFIPFFGSVTHLVLNDPSFDSPLTLFEFLSLFSCLDTLELGDSDFTFAKMPENAEYRHYISPTIRTLRLATSCDNQDRHLPDWLISSPTPCAFKEMSIQCRSVPGMIEVIDGAGPELSLQVCSCLGEEDRPSSDVVDAFKALSTSRISHLKVDVNISAQVIDMILGCENIESVSLVIERRDLLEDRFSKDMEPFSALERWLARSSSTPTIREVMVRVGKPSLTMPASRAADEIKADLKHRLPLIYASCRYSIHV